MKKVKLVSITTPESSLGIKSPEELITYCARVSNPNNQKNFATTPKLLKYCIDNKHWSIFEIVDLCVEIKTSRAISPQLLRHKSFTFQEFSQRYSQAIEMEPIELREQGKTNRQSSETVVNPTIKGACYTANELANQVAKYAFSKYNELIDNGVSKETARMILPLCTQTTLYMKGSVRSWLTYLNLRLHKHTQKEHRLIAEEIRDIFVEKFPIISKVFDNFKTAYEQQFI